MNNKYQYFKIKSEDSEQVIKFLDKTSINNTVANDPMMLVCENFVIDKLGDSPENYFESAILIDKLYRDYTNRPEGETHTRKLLDDIYNDWCSSTK